MASTSTLLTNIAARLSRCEDELGRGLQYCEQISRWNTEQQIEHATQVVARVLSKLTSEATEPLESPLKPIAKLMLFLGHIPRGRAQAPDYVRPHKRPPGEILELIESTKQLLKEIQDGKRQLTSAGFHHGFLGYFKQKQWLRFLSVHTDHHLRIVRDIRKRLA